MAHNQNESGYCVTYTAIRKAMENKYDITDERKEFYSEFLPESAVNRFTTEANVKKTLEEDDDFQAKDIDIDQLSKYISTKAKRLFLVFAYVDILKCIGQLQAKEFTDDDLPMIPVDESTLMRSLKNTDKSVKLKCSPRSCNEFAGDQWKFLIPTFHVDKFQATTYNHAQLFPYLEAKVLANPSGGFGAVRKVILHKDHSQGQSPYTTGRVKEFEIALKTLIINGPDSSITDVDKFYAKEWTTLEKMAEMKHAHLIRAIAAYEKGQQRCFVFPWAQGGNLSEFFKNQKGHSGSNVTSWSLKQILGLSKGIEKLQRRNIRHGDIKPLNILFFTKSKPEWENDPSGILVIADVGLAKFHEEYTKNRKERTTMNYRTVDYEPPEMTTHENDPVSRKYDLWSLGCVFLEFVIWMRDGSRGLNSFIKDLAQGGDKRFFRLTSNSSAKLNPAVTEWVDSNLKNPDMSDPVIVRLTDLITRYLLVVSKDDRKIGEFVEHLAKLNKEYRPNSQIEPDSAHVDTDFGTGNADSPAVNATAHRSNQRTTRLNDLWKNVTDNDLARSILTHLDWSIFRPSSDGQALCPSCSSLDFQLPEIALDRDIGELESGRSDCNLCNLLFQCFSNIETQLTGPITLVRDDAFRVLRVGSGGPPVLSLYSDPESSPGNLPYAQIGLPVLPEVASPRSFKLVNKWISMCNDSHDCMSVKNDAGHISTMPTRVIYVGDNNELRLVETNGNINDPYTALSHRWGDLTDDQKVCLKTTNIVSFKKDIPYSSLPKSFQDAVRVTNAIGVSYLWIDSLCIIQNDKSDWEMQSGKMEDVFSSAYCTVAATSAASSLVGFLGERTPRDCAIVETATGPLYLSQAIDNFELDVEEGVLNSRGWVLQERALSRRTIHFTSTQMYWECGHGVHCETLAQFRNPQAEIIGDADFPNSGLQYYKDERIRLVQYLYQVYCELNLTNEMDRPKAILGLESRLARTFKSTATYGVIWKFFERMLLWQPMVAGSLSRIAYSNGASIPTWSWMAYTGKIKYVDIPFATVDWLPNLENPFNDGVIEGWNGSLNANASDLVFDGEDVKGWMILDSDEYNYDRNTWKCIVLGRSRMATQDSNQFLHYVLLVRLASSEIGHDTYERVGVGALDGSQFSSHSTKIHFV